MGLNISKSNVSNISRLTSLFNIINYIPNKFKLKLLISFILILIAGVFEAETVKYITILLNQISGNSININIINYKYSSYLFILFVLASAISRIIIFRINANIGASIGNYLAGTIFKELVQRDYETSLYDKEEVDIDLITLQVTKTGAIINNLLTVLSAVFISIFIIYSIRNIGILYIIMIFLSFLTIYLFLGYFIKNQLQLNSKIAIDSNRFVVKKIQEIACLRSEINLGLNPNPFLKEFYEVDKQGRMANASSQYLGYLPRYLIEGIFLAVGIAIISIIYAKQGGSIIISLFGTLAFAFQKLLPNAQQIFYGWSILNANGDSLIEVNKVLKRLNSKNFY